MCDDVSLGPVQCPSSTLRNDEYPTYPSEKIRFCRDYIMKKMNLHPIHCHFLAIGATAKEAWRVELLPIAYFCDRSQSENFFRFFS